MVAFQHDESAYPPCTNTIVGLVAGDPGEASAAPLSVMPAAVAAAAGADTGDERTPGNGWVHGLLQG